MFCDDLETFTFRNKNCKKIDHPNIINDNNFMNIRDNNINISQVKTENAKIKGEQKNAYIFQIKIALLVLIEEKYYTYR